MTEHAKLELAKADKKERKFLQLLKERDTIVENFQIELKAADSAKQDMLDNFECEKERLCRILKEKNVAVEKLGKELEVLKQESATTELVRVEAEMKFEYEKEEMSRVISGKYETIRNLEGFASALEKDLGEVFLYALCKEFENLVQMISLQEALEKNKLTLNFEIEKKKTTIGVLEVEVNDLHNKILLQESDLLHSNQLNKELEALMEANKLEMEKLTQEFGESRAKLKKLVKDLEHKNEAATNNINILSSERESLLIYVEGVCEQFGDLCRQDVELDGMLLKMMQNSGKGL